MKKYLITLGILTIFKMVAVPLWLSNSCGKCKQVCPMDVDVTDNLIIFYRWQQP